MTQSHAYRSLLATLGQVRLQLELEALLHGPQPDSQLKDWLTAHTPAYRVSTFAGYVILLYGALERYLESVVVEYLETLARYTDNYLNLPKSVRDEHRRLSVELLLSIERGNQRFQHVVPASLLEGLLYWERNQKPVKINSYAFAQHTTFTVDVVCDFLRRIGFSAIVPDIVGLPSGRRFLEQRGHTGIERTPLKVLFSDINALAVSRNEVAHGDLQNIVSSPTVADWCSSVEVFCGAIDHSLVCGLATSAFSQTGFPSLSPIMVLPRSPFRIVCFELVSGEVRKGGLLLRLEGSPPAFRVTDLAPIDAVVRDDVECLSVSGGPGVKVAVRVLFPEREPTKSVLYGVLPALL